MVENCISKESFMTHTVRSFTFAAKEQCKTTGVGSELLPVASPFEAARGWTSIKLPQLERKSSIHSLSLTFPLVNGNWDVCHNQTGTYLSLRGLVHLFMTNRLEHGLNPSHLFIRKFTCGLAGGCVILCTNSFPLLFLLWCIAQYFWDWMQVKTES